MHSSRPLRSDARVLTCRRPDVPLQPVAREVPAAALHPDELCQPLRVRCRPQPSLARLPDVPVLQPDAGPRRKTGLLGFNPLAVGGGALLFGFRPALGFEVLLTLCFFGFRTLSQLHGRRRLCVHWRGARLPAAAA